MLKGTTEDNIKELLQHIDKTKLLCGIQFPWESTRALLLHAVHMEEAMKSRENVTSPSLKSTFSTSLSLLTNTSSILQLFPPNCFRNYNTFFSVMNYFSGGVILNSFWYCTPFTHLLHLFK